MNVIEKVKNNKYKNYIVIIIIIIVFYSLFKLYKYFQNKTDNELKNIFKAKYNYKISLTYIWIEQFFK